MIWLLHNFAKGRYVATQQTEGQGCNRSYGDFKFLKGQCAK